MFKLEKLQNWAAAGVALAAIATAAADDVLWDTGAPHQVKFNGADTYLGLSSGNLNVDNPQRWMAVPFRIEVNNAVIHQINVDWFIVAGSEAETVDYVIWKRTDLNKPVDGDQVSTGTLGAFGAGIDDPRIDITEDWLHEYKDLEIPLDKGDYYLSVFGNGGTAPNNVPWLTGGDLQAEDLEHDFAWRSAKFPDPGFAEYNPANLEGGTNMADAQDRFNASFTMYGVPEPTTFMLLMMGLLGLARRR